MKLRLDLRLSQKLIMTPQLQQAIKLLQLSRLELQQTLAQHLDENPMLEEVEGDTEEGDAIGSEEWSGDKQDMAQAGSGETGEAKAEDSENPEELSAAGW
ncbi:MAG: RNA polymerase factor sigma-54, partial [Nitrospiraceae bacterium]